MHAFELPVFHNFQIEFPIEWRHTDTFPYSRFCLLFLVSKKSPIILKEIPA